MTQTVIEAQGLGKFLRYLRSVGGKTLPAQLTVASKVAADDVAAVVAGAIPHGKASDRDKHPGALAGSVRGLASQRVAHVQIGRGVAGAYARPQFFGRKGRYKRMYDPVMDRIEAIELQIREEYVRAVIEALASAAE